MKKATILKAAPLFFLSLFSDNVWAQTEKETIENKEFTIPNPTRYEAFYDIKTGRYYLYPKIGNLVVGEPLTMTPLQYSQYLQDKNIREYFRQKAGEGTYAQIGDKEEEAKKVSRLDT